MKKRILFGVLILFNLFIENSYGAPFKLTNSGCTVYWPFSNSSLTSCPTSGNSTGSDGWVVTCGPGCNFHINGDAYADDWIRYDAAGNNISVNEDFKAPISGTVIVASWFNSGNACNNSNVCSYGRQVVIRSNVDPSFAFRVTHLNSINVSVGATVNVGDLIGKVGASSCCTMDAHAHCAMYKEITNSIVTTYLQAGATPPSNCAVPWCFGASNVSTPACTSTKFVTGNIASGVHHYYAADFIYLHDAVIPSNATCYFHAKELRGYGTIKVDGKIHTLKDPCTLGQPVPQLKEGTTNSEMTELHLDEFEIFPNPANNQVQIRTNIVDDERNLLLMIYDMSGKRLQNKMIDFRSGDVFIDLSAYPKGVYLLKLINEEGLSILDKKVIKE